MSELVIMNDSLDLQVYFAKQDHNINAYTLASVLVSLTDAIRAANRHINPGFEVEVIVVTLDDGSFKAVLKTIYKAGKNLFSNQIVSTIVLGVVTSMIYDNWIAKKPEMKVEITQEMVIVSDGSDRIIIPRDVYDAKNKIQKIEEVKRPIENSIQNVKADKTVEGFGLAGLETQKPQLLIDRNFLDDFDPSVITENPERQRVIFETCKVEILRAILRKSNRKWEFVWHGTEISAPITDVSFYKKFEDHKYRIAPGDAFDVELKIVQERHEGTEIFVNKSYEVVHVLGHDPKRDKNQDL
jgi:hypothetical protein